MQQNIQFYVPHKIWHEKLLTLIPLCVELSEILLTGKIASENRQKFQFIRHTKFVQNCDILWLLLAFLNHRNSSPHPLSLYGKEQREHLAKYLILSSTEERVIQVWSNIRDVFFFIFWWTISWNIHKATLQCKEPDWNDH